jgi:hypothetical protein
MQRCAMKPDLTDRWTAILDCDLIDRKSAKGKAPESWLCVDCGINTAPGLPNRKEVELEIAIKGVAKCCYTWDATEVYTVKDKIWKRTGLGPKDGCLCIGCLEKRIGRRLKPKDFDEHVLNEMPASERLCKRQGRRR